MIDPNATKLVFVDVLPYDAETTGSQCQVAVYKGFYIEIMDYERKTPGRRRMELNYSIMLDRYTLRTPRK
jgi:hypothetical protein